MILNFTDFLFESKSVFKMTNETKSTLLKLDEEYHKLIEKFRTKYVAQTCVNIRDEFDKFMKARENGQKYYPQLEIENSEVDLSMIDKFKALMGKFEDIKNDCYIVKFYIDKMNCLCALPNDCHKYLAKLEKSGKLTGIITQNIDGLHQKAGSKNVYELHGSIYKNHCTKCNKKIDAIDIFNGKYMCDCGGIIKPDVVLYEEPLDDNVLSNSINLISNADMLIIGGTSLTVYPASNLVRYFNGKYLVVINKQNTYIDNMATLVINDKIGEVFKELEKEVIY